MKLILRFLLLLALMSGLALAQTDADDDAGPDDVKQQAVAKPGKAAKIPEPRGPSILIDAKTGEVLSQDRAGEPWYPASLTKMMTAYVIFQKLRAGTLKPDQQLTVSELAHSQEPSKIGVPVGKTVSLDFALQTTLVYSANDMAYVLAEGASGSIEAFADEMNASAKRLGLSATHFQNPNGLFDPRHVSSARDMAVLAAIIIAEFPEYQHYFSQKDVAVGKRRLRNRNILIRTMPDADGMKTGFVCASGFNLVASATRNGRRLIAVVMGMKNSFARAEAAKALLNSGFAMPANPTRGKAGEIVNLPQGAIVPVDMTGTVCRHKPPVTIDDGTRLSGWAVSFGTYDTDLKAGMALRGRALNPIGVDAKGKTGIIRMPGKAGFSPLIWGLGQSASLALCQQYRAEGAQCEVLPPVLMEQIASTAKAQQAARAAAISQGSDGAAPSSKSRKKYKRRFSH